MIAKIKFRNYFRVNLKMKMQKILSLILFAIIITGCAKTVETEVTIPEEKDDLPVQETEQIKNQEEETNPDLPKEVNGWLLIVDTDLGKKFTGNTQLTGTVVMKDMYVDMIVPHIHLEQSQLKKLPEKNDHTEFRLTGTDQEVFEKYKESSITIVVNELSIMGEGSQSLNVVEIIP